MSRRLPLPCFATYWRTLSGALLLVFLLRATIPVGYMPAHTSGPAGLPGMTFCVQGVSAGAIKNLAFEDKRQAEPAVLDCAVGLLISQAALPLTAAALFIPVAADVRPAFRLMAVYIMQLAVRGPPLGPRAPPVLLS